MSDHKYKRLFWQTRHNPTFMREGEVNRKSNVIYRKRKDRSDEIEKCCFCGNDIGKRMLVLGDYSRCCTPCARNIFALVTVWFCIDHTFTKIPGHPEYQQCAHCTERRLRPDIAAFRAEERRIFEMAWAFTFYAE